MICRENASFSWKYSESRNTTEGIKYLNERATNLILCHNDQKTCSSILVVKEKVSETRIRTEHVVKIMKNHHGNALKVPGSPYLYTWVTILRTFFHQLLCSTVFLWEYKALELNSEMDAIFNHQRPTRDPHIFPHLVDCCWQVVLTRLKITQVSWEKN